jgi:segregation and condensation protein A
VTDGVGRREPDEADHAWEDPPRAPATSGVPVLSVDGFEGPLDWLLDLARAERIDLRRVSILALVEAFAGALQAALAAPGRVDLSRWGEFLAMAAQLALLRSRLLLPPEAADRQAAHADAEALRRFLLERDALRRAASWLDRRPQLGRDVFARAAAEPAPSSARGADIADLSRACLVALLVPEHAEAYALPRPPLWRVGDAMARITRLLAEGVEGELERFLPHVDEDGPDRDLRCRAALASTLVAGLELARGGSVSLGQSGPWQPIQLVAAAREVA